MIATVADAGTMCPGLLPIGTPAPYCLYLPHSRGPVAGRCSPVIGDDGFENMNAWRIPGRPSLGTHVEVSSTAARTGALGLLLENKSEFTQGVGVDSEATVHRKTTDRYILQFWYRYQGVPSNSSASVLRMCVRPDGASWDCVNWDPSETWLKRAFQASAEWRQETVDITLWRRTSIDVFRLRIDTSAVGPGETWHVDDVVLWSCPPGSTL